MLKINMLQSLKKIVLAMLLALPLVMGVGFNDVQSAEKKNPCAAKNPCSMKNPCAMKNPCGMKGMKNPCGMMKNPCTAKNPCAKNPCAANPCAMKPKPIRKVAVKDNAKLMEMGEKLWNDTKLGKSGTACATCHADGKGLKKSPFPKYIKMANDILTLDQMINFCMMNPMKGKPLQWSSPEMTALAAYAQSHAKEEGTPANPCAAKNPCGMKNPCGKK